MRQARIALAAGIDGLQSLLPQSTGDASAASPENQGCDR